MESDISQHRSCGVCRSINLEDMKSNNGYVHQPTCDALIISGHTCDLCQLIVDIFERYIYEQRLATSSIRQLSDAGHLGPVRLFAANRELDLNQHPFQRRERGRVKDKLLSKRVAMTFGMVNTELGYGLEYPNLLMFADPGK